MSATVTLKVALGLKARGLRAVILKMEVAVGKIQNQARD